MSDEDVDRVRKFHLVGGLVEEGDSVAESLLAGNGARQFEDRRVLIDGVDPPGTRLAGKERVDAGSGPQVEDRIPALNRLGDGLPKSLLSVLIGEQALVKLLKAHFRRTYWEKRPLCHDPTRRRTECRMGVLRQAEASQFSAHDYRRKEVDYTPAAFMTPPSAPAEAPP